MAVCISKLIAVTTLVSITWCEGKSPPCKLWKGDRYYKTGDDGYQLCTEEECPGYKPGRHHNCFCCRGNDNKPVAGQWSNWNSWSNCSSTAKGYADIRHRIRICSQPYPLNNGSLCSSDQPMSTMREYDGLYEMEKEQCPFTASSGTYVHPGWIVLCAVLLAVFILSILAMAVWIRVLKRGKMIPCMTTTKQVLTENDMESEIVNLVLQENHINVDNTRVMPSAPANS